MPAEEVIKPLRVFVELDNPDEDIQEIHKRCSDDEDFLGIQRRGNKTVIVLTKKPSKQKESKLKSLGKKTPMP